MKQTQSLPGIKFIGTVPANNLQRDLMLRHLAGLTVSIPEDITPIAFCGVPTCQAVSMYNKNGRIEETVLHFKTLDALPLNRHVAFIITDCNNKSYVIGQRECPRPIVKVTSETGAPDGAPAVSTVEITFYAQKSLIPCNISL